MPNHRGVSKQASKQFSNPVEKITPSLSSNTNLQLQGVVPIGKKHLGAINMSITNLLMDESKQLSTVANKINVSTKFSNPVEKLPRFYAQIQTLPHEVNK